MSLRLLLVEDDRELRGTLREALQVEGYQVLTAASLAEAVAMHAQTQLVREPQTPFDLVLLDLGLPDGDGSELLKKLRQKNAVPVIVLSARETEAAKIRLLDEGADDYLVKPFNIGELLARIRVALRHSGNWTRPAVRHYQYAGVTVDLENHQVARAGSQIHLTPTEFKLLARLVRSTGQVVTHRQLLTDVCACIWASCGPSWKRTPRSRNSCSPNRAWATACWTQRRDRHAQNKKPGRMLGIVNRILMRS
jgi:two-component system KDP operon response regulator KdpE